MEINRINVKKIEKEGSRMKAIVSLLIDDQIAIHDIRVIEGDQKLFVAFPSRKTATGEYKDIVHPINPEARAVFEAKIIEAYNNAEDEVKEEN